MINPQSIDQTTRKIRGHYEGFSRTTRIIVIVGIVGFLLLGILESWRIAEELGTEADALVVQINRAKNADKDLTISLRSRVRSLGSIRLPTSDLNPFEAETRLFESVHTILEDNNAEMIQVDVLPSANLPASAAPEIRRGAQQKLGKIIVRAEFQCTQDDITKVIHALENDPEVYTISRLQLDRFMDGPEEVRRLVKIDVTIESWVLKTTVSRRSG
jgi:hypothetical protein